MAKPRPISPKELAALQHWASYGQPGKLPEERATATQWTTHPFKKPVSSSWYVPVRHDDLSSLLMGFVPDQMEDKWFVYADGPNDDSQVKLHFFRSWTGFKIAEVTIDKDTTEGAREGTMCITGIIWESSEEITTSPSEASAKEMVREVCRWIMHVQLDDKEK